VFAPAQGGRHDAAAIRAEAELAVFKLGVKGFSLADRRKKTASPGNVFLS
jgi:hypothetical protein